MNINNDFINFSCADAAVCLPQRDVNSNKGDFGYIALVGGSIRYSGAIRLANMAGCTLRAGAGVVSVAAPDVICNAIMPGILESTLIPLSSEDGYIKFRPGEFDEIIRRYDVIAFGMGIGNTKETEKAVAYLLENYKGILVVDADGINAMARLEKAVISRHRGALVITPHLKEFSRIYGLGIDSLKGKTEECAIELAKEIKGTVLLKGHVTLVTDGRISYSVSRGCPGMATAGSGDVLSGITAAICASNKERLTEAVAASAYINGLAGELAEKENGQISMIASDTACNIKNAIKQIQSQCTG